MFQQWNNETITLGLVLVIQHALKNELKKDKKQY